MTQDNTERRWLGAYPEGVPADVDVSAYGSLVDLLENNFARYSDRACVSFMGKELTYGEINIRPPWQWPLTFRVWAW